MNINKGDSIAPVEKMMELISSLGRLGWYRLAPVDPGEFDRVPTLTFHVHPDDADEVEASLLSILETCDRERGWCLERKQGNRFFMCPAVLVEKGRSEGKLTVNTIKNLRAESPSVGVKANEDLLGVVECAGKYMTKYKLNRENGL